jgi:hypothetical protein
MWEPEASRYLYVGIVAIVTGLFESFGRDFSMTGTRRFAIGLVALGAVWGSHAQLVNGAGWLKNEGDIVGAELAVVMMHREGLDPLIAVDPIHAPMLTVGPYLAAADDLGSSAAIDPQELPTASEQARLGADLLLNSLVEAQPLHDAPSCKVENEPGGQIQLVPGSSMVMKILETTAFGISRFAPQEISRAGMRSIEAGLYQIDIPVDVVNVPWTLTLEIPSDVRICDM